MSRQSRFSKVMRRLAVPVVLAATTVGLATAPAEAASVNANGWTFQTDIHCDPIGHRVSIKSVTGGTTSWTSAYTAYIVWVRYNNGDWTMAVPMKEMGLRVNVLDYPFAEYTTPGQYEFFVWYGIWANGGYSWYGDDAVHWIEYDGFTWNGGDRPCAI